MDKTLKTGLGYIEKGAGIATEVFALLDLLHGAWVPAVFEALIGLVLWKDADRRLRS